MYAHRFAYELEHGPIPSGDHYGTTCVLHRCDNRLCVNPDHLFLGTIADNVRDMDAKGRRGSSADVGSKKGTAVLREKDIPNIRQMLSDGSTCQSVADKYGVARATISDIKLGKTWGHVENTHEHH